MDELRPFRDLPRVEAPPGFEARVFARIAQEKSRRARRTRFAFRSAFAGAGALLLAVAVWLGPLRRPAEPGAPSSVIPLVERVDYAAEARTGSAGATPVVYILEQVSEAPVSGISY